jgi:hypothetical protein
MTRILEFLEAYRMVTIAVPVKGEMDEKAIRTIRRGSC